MIAQERSENDRIGAKTGFNERASCYIGVWVVIGVGGMMSNMEGKQA